MPSPSPSDAAAVPAVLSIAGSDSGGGAGIQADLKAFARCGVHGMTAITALTAQNTVGVTGVHPVAPAFVVEQVRAVAGDLRIAAVKIGMLGTREIVEAVAEALDLIEQRCPGAPVVIDPVMVAESGAILLDEEAREALRTRLLPRATVITPNVPEARVLAGAGAAGQPPATAAGEEEARRLARELHALGPRAVIVTGGHREEASDILFDGEGFTVLTGPRHPDGAAHGSGCTHSSALAAHLALGDDLKVAAQRAKAIASEAVANGLRHLGSGPGPVDALDLGARSWRRAREAVA